MKIEKIKIEKIIPYENNPRHNEFAVREVANSIKEFGFKVPLVIDGDNVVVAGHTRLLAAKKLGMKVLPCIRANDLSKEQIKAFRLVDNKVGELSEWEFNKLEAELDQIGLDGNSFSMADFGFIASEMKEEVLREEEVQADGKKELKLVVTEDELEFLDDLQEQLETVGIDLVEWIVEKLTAVK